MYHYIFEKKLRRVFKELNAGNYEPVLSTLAPRFEHRFLGDHSFGGVRYTVESYRRWFQRLFVVFPDLRFEIKGVLVKGWPWDTVAVVEWVDFMTTWDGQLHSNSGVHVMRFRWGRAVEIRIHLDTQKIAALCRSQAQLGVEEAMAAPILG